MKTIQLTKGQVTTVSDKDYKLVSAFNWYARLRKNGDNYDAVASIEGKKVVMSRLLCGQSAVGLVVDHRDGNTLNNCRSNLRPCTNSQNLMNRGKNKNNTIGFKGVEKHGKKYRAVCEVNGVMYRSPMFQTAYEASEEYRKLSKKLHGKYAKS